MTLASYVVFPVLLYFVHVYVYCIWFRSIDDSRSLSYLIWTAVRTDYWTDLNIFSLKNTKWWNCGVMIKSRIAWNQYVSTCTYKVSFTPMLLYLSVGKALEYLLCVVLSSKAQIQLKTKAGFYCCILTYCMR